MPGSRFPIPDHGINVHVSPGIGPRVSGSVFRVGPAAQEHCKGAEVDIAHAGGDRRPHDGEAGLGLGLGGTDAA
ncbi:MAG TPA: hypothetical protein VFY15_04735, partial [Acidimicrobiia bacterium]|nr:hypothetical protein [Acidimicrobiia bacterium]